MGLGLKAGGVVPSKVLKVQQTEACSTGLREVESF